MAPLITSVVTSYDQKTQKDKFSPYISLYAQTLIVVALIVVNFFGFSVITRDHGSFEGRHLVEMNPTSLPELSKPSRASENLRKAKMLETKILEKPGNYY